jgi:hypothetical protein
MNKEKQCCVACDKNYGPTACSECKCHQSLSWRERFDERFPSESDAPFHNAEVNEIKDWHRAELLSLAEKVEEMKKPVEMQHYKNCHKNTGKSLKGECACGLWRNEALIWNAALEAAKALLIKEAQ